MVSRKNFVISLVYSIFWLAFSLFFAIPWIGDVSAAIHPIIAWLAISGSALIPGFAMAFINSSLYIRKRRKYEIDVMPDVSILIAAYNEERTIRSTIESIVAQRYSGMVEVIVCNDGSSDDTLSVAEDLISSLSVERMSFRVVSSPVNIGKANVLNLGLAEASNGYVITLDADSELKEDAVFEIMSCFEGSDKRYAAVAGTILVKNGFENMMTRVQRWDYLLGISSVKKVQSMHYGTLVAQGAFSAYRRDVLLEVGGWPDTIGEDIVLSWKILEIGRSIGHSDSAVCYTNVPVDYTSFYKQRKRWSRGLIEAFRSSYMLLFTGKRHSLFIWYNFFFPLIDLSYLAFFVPGVLISLFMGMSLLAGAMTLYLIPILLFYGTVIYRIQARHMKDIGEEMKSDWFGLLIYAVFYQLLMNPATVHGYFSEIIKAKRIWR